LRCFFLILGKNSHDDQESLLFMAAICVKVKIICADTLCDSFKKKFGASHLVE